MYPILFAGSTTPRLPLYSRILRTARYYPGVSEALHHTHPADYSCRGDQELATCTHIPFNPIVSSFHPHTPHDRSQKCVMAFTHRCSAFQPSEERRSPYMCIRPGRTPLSSSVVPLEGLQGLMAKWEQKVPQTNNGERCEREEEDKC